MKFINRNAYILTAINGTNFCSSAKEAFSLILRNCVRVVVLDKVAHSSALPVIIHHLINRSRIFCCFLGSWLSPAVLLCCHSSTSLVA